MKNIKLVAMDIDGVALPDTFSPVIYKMIKSWGYEYTAEIERNLFSQNRVTAAEYLIQKFHLESSPQELIQIYFQERKKYLENNDIHPVDGLKGFLDKVIQLDLKIVCYGGLERSHFDAELGAYADYFDGEKYICTNEFRPGIKEIVRDFYDYSYNNVLFIDDVNKVAEHAKEAGAPFIGIPSSFPFGHQKKDMMKTGVKYMVNSLAEIDEILLKKIDTDISAGKIWRR